MCRVPYGGEFGSRVRARQDKHFTASHLFGRFE
jgi:hypothetical protein